MKNKNLLEDNSAQFVLSYELLYLLNWIIEREEETLKKMITKAFKEGLAKKMNRIGTNIEESHTDNEYHSIINFFELLEILLIETTNEHLITKAREKNLIPAIDQIDSTLCDNKTIQLSLKKATNESELDPTINVKDLLLKELLKRWQPHKKNIMN